MPDFEKLRFLVQSTSTDFTQALDIVLNSADQWKYVVIEKAIVPKTYLMLPDAATLVVADAIGTQNLSFIAGNWTLALIAAVLDTLVGYSVAKPGTRGVVDTGRYTFTTARASATLRTSSSALARMLGFEANTTYPFTGGVLQSATVATLERYDTLLLKSTLVKDPSHILAPIFSVQDAYQSSIVYESQDVLAACSNVSDLNSNVFRFWLTDGSGAVIDLGGAQWSFQLCLLNQVLAVQFASATRTTGQTEPALAPGQ